MEVYDLLFIITVPLYMFSVFFLMNAFFRGNISELHSKIFVWPYLLYSFLSIFIFFYNRTPIIFLFFNLTSFFIISLNYASNFFKRIINIILIYFIFLIIEIAASVVIGFIDISIFEISRFNSVLGLILIRVSTLMCSYFVYRFKDYIKINFPLPSYYYFVHIIILLGILILFIFSLEKKNITINDVILSSLIVIVINGLIIFLNEKIYFSILIYTEQNNLKIQNESYENQSNIINNSIENIKSLEHDIKNHILSLSLLYENDKKEEARAYVETIFNNIDSDKHYLKSNNFIIDSIVNLKLQELKINDVVIRFSASIPPKLDILPYDLTIILGNLFDNAIEALNKLSKADDKRFSLNITYSKGSLIIIMENTFDGKISKYKDKIYTTKKNRFNHGRGIQNIEYVVERYGGSFEIEILDNIFSVSILIPS